MWQPASVAAVSIVAAVGTPFDASFDIVPHQLGAAEIVELPINIDMLISST